MIAGTRVAACGWNTVGWWPVSRHWMKERVSIFMLELFWVLPRLNCIPGISCTMWVARAPGRTKISSVRREKQPEIKY